MNSRVAKKVSGLSMSGSHKLDTINRAIAIHNKRGKDGWVLGPVRRTPTGRIPLRVDVEVTR